jgi:hypothetical protein
MSELSPTAFIEEGIPTAGIEQAIDELVELYGGTMNASRAGGRDFTLPLRRGVATAGAVECTLSWTAEPGADATVTLTCNRDVDAPKAQRIAMLSVGVIGALLFMIWPFFPQAREMGTLAWIGGLAALAVYFLTLKRTSGGIAYDFLRRLAIGQRESEVGTRE